MPTGRRKMSDEYPVLAGWGGVKSVQRRLERTKTIIHNQEAIAYQLLAMGNTKITDVLDWDDEGNVRVKAASRIPEHALMAIKSVKATIGKDGSRQLEVELYDKVQVMRLLAKAAGLLDRVEDEDGKPSVIDVNVVAPEQEKDE